MDNPTKQRKDDRTKIALDRTTLERLRILSAIQDRPMVAALRGAVDDALDKETR